jgi:hypothetical protein
MASPQVSLQIVMVSSRWTLPLRVGGRQDRGSRLSRTATTCIEMRQAPRRGTPAGVAQGLSRSTDPTEKYEIR